MALRGKPWDNVEGRFLGGTHSVRPRRTAFRMPGHFIPTRCVGERPAAYRPHASVKLVPSLRACGARPSEGGLAQRGWPSEGRSEMTRKAIFSEGRGLRVRIVRPCECRGIPFQPGLFRIGPWPKGSNVGVSVMPSFRACGARPSEGGQTQRRWPHGGKPGDDAKGDFLEGTRSPRPHCEAVRKARHNVIIKGQSNARWPSGDMLG